MWAGDQNAADTKGSDIKDAPLAVNPVKTTNEDAVTDPPAPDFLAVIDATPSSSTYGKVVNTATVGPLVENEPHHMQYLYHKGDKIFAGGLFSSATYVFDVSKLPTVSLSGVSLPTDTRGGSIPDAFWTLPDHTAYATYMGGPVVPGPYTYSDGETRIGNGYGGSPGELVHFDTTGKVLRVEGRKASIGFVCGFDFLHGGERGGNFAGSHRTVVIVGTKGWAVSVAGQAGGPQHLPSHGPHLGHQQGERPQGRLGDRAARRPSGRAEPGPRGAAGDHGGHRHQPAPGQRRLRRVDVRRRDLLLARYHGRQAGVAGGLRRHRGLEGPQP